MSNSQAVPMTQLHDLFESAHLLGGISPWTLRKHVARGTVAVVRLGRRVFLRSEEIERIRRNGLPPLRASQTDRSVGGVPRVGRT